MLTTSLFVTGGLAFAALAVVFGFWVLALRTIVAPNDVHIITQGKKVISYGKDMRYRTKDDDVGETTVGELTGNIYYKWPKWLPVLGLNVEILPVSNFELKLVGYEGYDENKVDFVIDVTTFFRIANTNLAAQRVENFEILKDQLEEIVRGAVRRILATTDIEKIMVERAKLGKAFTESVETQIAQWGVETVKDIEFMDIRDTHDGKVIFNIMERKRSFIDRESRVEVAKNLQGAETAEIAARQAVQIADQVAIQAVGERKALQEQQVGVANEKSKQEIKAELKTTTERDMAVLQVQEVKNAEIIKEKSIVKADEVKATTIIAAEGQKEKAVIDAEASREQDVIRAEGEKSQTVLVSEGELTKEQNNAKGIEAVGLAEGVAEEAILMAPVTAQITLADKIGSNENYQSYLQNIEGINAHKVVGVANASALEESDMKIIVNAGDIGKGFTSVGDLFTSKGGTHLGGMIEGLSQVPGGAALLERFGVKLEAGNDIVEAGVEAVAEKLTKTGSINNDTRPVRPTPKKTSSK